MLEYPISCDELDMDNCRLTHLVMQNLAHRVLFRPAAEPNVVLLSSAI